jgi:hypothetical protein
VCAEVVCAACSITISASVVALSTAIATMPVFASACICACGARFAVPALLSVVTAFVVVFVVCVVCVVVLVLVCVCHLCRGCSCCCCLL